jgi:opacity protein-like surface antigen
MKNYSRRFMGFALASTVLIACPALAADLSKQPTLMPSDPGWEYQISLDAWATALNGEIGIRGLPPANVNLSAWDAIQHLDGALAGSFQATDGTWLLYSDFMWAKVSADAGFGPSTGRAEFEQQQILFTALLGHSLPLDIQNLQLFATAGLRYQHYSADLAIDPALFPKFSREGSKSWIDPVVGLKLRYDINNDWFIDANADVGGFGLGSDFTAQGKFAVGYNWTDTLSSTLGYRVLYTNYDKDGFVYNATQHGVFTNLIVRF